jgi:hypothetical protein
MRESPDRPLALTAASVFLMAFGILALCGGLLWLIGRVDGLVFGAGPSSLWAEVESVGVAGIASGILMIATAVGSWRGRGWARGLLILVGVLCVVYPIVRLYYGASSTTILVVLLGAASLWYVSRPRTRLYFGETSWATLPESSLPKTSEERTHAGARRWAAVVVLVLLVYGCLYVSGASDQSYVLSLRQSLTRQVITPLHSCTSSVFPVCNSAYGPAGYNIRKYLAVADLENSQGKVVFSFPFTVYWIPTAGYSILGKGPIEYTGGVGFFGAFDACPSGGPEVSALNVTYIWTGSEFPLVNEWGDAAPTFALDPFSVLNSGYGSIISHQEVGGQPVWFGSPPMNYTLSYSGLERGDCPSTVQTTGFDTTIFTSPPSLQNGGFYNDSIYGFYTYSYDVVLHVTLLSPLSSAAPFVGQAYTGRVTIPIEISGNGTVSLGGLGRPVD